MKLSIVTPKGKGFEKEVDYVVVNGDNGELAILKNHVPIVVSIRDGYVKHVCEKEEVYHVVCGGLLEFSNDTIIVISQETTDGKTLDEATSKLDEIRKNQKEANRQFAMDFSKMERDLALNLKEIQASKL